MRKAAVGFVLVTVALTATACGTPGAPSVSPSASPAAPPAGNSVSASATPAEWSYEGATGPDHWGDIAPACSTTPESTESPIDIEKTALAVAPAADVAAHYTPTPFEVESNGHTIEAVPQDTKQNWITVDGTPHYLQQFHFHAQSEHRIDGVNAPLELHLVHRSDAGDLAVLSVLLDSGAANEPLAELFTTIPAEENENAPVELHHQVDVAALLPADPALAQYQGSLTTPPCTEGVRWNVFLTPTTVSAEQLAAYTAAYAGNSRPVQPLNGRVVVGTTLG